MQQPHLVVDAMNVIGTRPTGWWRDRPAAVRRLADMLRLLAQAEGRRVTLVVDGQPFPNLPEGADGALQVLYATRPGRDSADDRIVDFVRSEGTGEGMEVVTADARLAERVRSLGARVSGPGRLLRRLDALAQRQG